MGQQDYGPSDCSLLIHGVTPDVELDSPALFPLSKTLILWNQCES